MKNNLAKVLAWMLLVCLAAGQVCGALAQEAKPAASEFEMLQPLMDLVSGAVMVASDEPQPVPGAEGTLSNAFVSAFFQLGMAADPALGITADILGDPAKQGEYLSKVFAAKAPELAAIQQPTPINGYIGFQPVTVNTAAETGGIQIIGEIYWADKPMKALSEADYLNVKWQDARAIFTFQSDNAALNGFRLTGFSMGTELNMEQAMQTYFEKILVEYISTNLGFSVQYPSVFTDELLVEDQDGVSASLPDGSASFFAKRVDNVNHANLQDYVSVIANGITGAKSQVNEKFQYATVSYTTAEGKTVFDVYIVTDKYIYQAELSYLTKLSNQYHMYTTYLENNFTVNEVSVG